jgi:sialate O-acetylesterase
MRIIFTIIFLTSIFSCSTTRAHIDNNEINRPLLDYIFSDNVVLQIGKPIKFWGWTEPNNKVSVTFNNQEYKIKSKKTGHWEIEIIEPKNEGPFTIEISTDKDSIAIKNIVLGDVWICAGQSNMDWPLSKTDNYSAEQSKCCPDFRYRKIKKSISDHAAIALNKSNNQEWLITSKINHGTMSGVAYHFGQRLKTYNSNPLGILEITYPDSRIEAWLKHGNRHTNPTSKAYNKPSVVFNEMIAPIKKFPVKGIVWYQGESNNLDSLDSYDYRDKLSQLITEYRNIWGDDLNVIIIQLPNYESIPIDGNANWAILRESQSTVNKIHGVTTVTTIDLGEANNLHPTEKLTIGKRAAIAAESLLLDTDNLSSGPLYKGHFRRNNQITIEFDNVGEGLENKKGSEVQFHYLKKNGVRKAITGQIINNQIIIDLFGADLIIELQYAWENNPDHLTLYNQAGYPASSFRVKL